MITALVLLWLFGLPQQPVIVTQFGADPTGQQDSAAALRLAVSVAVARDCGALAYCSDDGNAIYLDGGDYLLGQPK